MKLKHISIRTKKYLYIGSVSLVMIAGACAVFAHARNHNDMNGIPSKTKISSASNPTEPEASVANDFVMVTTMGLSYRATVEADHRDDASDRIILMDRDGANGASRLTSKMNNEVTAKVFSGEVTYDCDRESCEKMIWRDDAPYADNTVQLAYDFGPDAIQRLKSRVVFKGEADCPAGTCLAWEAAPDDTLGEQYSQMLYIDKRTKSISKVVRTYTRTKYTDTITYAYQPRTITLPPVPQEVPDL